MEFQIDRFEPDGIVIGRNGYANTLAKRRLDGELPIPTIMYLGNVAALDLRLTEVQWFGRDRFYYFCLLL